MEIGGDDVIFDVEGLTPENTLSAATRMLLGLWPRATLQDGKTEAHYVGYHRVPFGQLSELLVYETPEYEAELTRLGATPELSPHYVYLLASSPGSFTMVCHSRRLEPLASLIIALQQLFDRGMPGTPAARLPPLSK